MAADFQEQELRARSSEQRAEEEGVADHWSFSVLLAVSAARRLE